MTLLDFILNIETNAVVFIEFIEFVMSTQQRHEYYSHLM